MHIYPLTYDFCVTLIFVSSYVPRSSFFSLTVLHAEVSGMKPVQKKVAPISQIATGSGNSTMKPTSPKHQCEKSHLSSSWSMPHWIDPSSSSIHSSSSKLISPSIRTLWKNQNTREDILWWCGVVQTECFDTSTIRIPYFK
jgi:hypothetical protein